MSTGRDEVVREASGAGLLAADLAPDRAPASAERRHHRRLGSGLGDCGGLGRGLGGLRRRDREEVVRVGDQRHRRERRRSLAPGLLPGHGVIDRHHRRRCLGISTAVAAEHLGCGLGRRGRVRAQARGQSVPAQGDALLRRRELLDRAGQAHHRLSRRLCPAAAVVVVLGGLGLGLELVLLALEHQQREPQPPLVDHRQDAQLVAQPAQGGLRLTATAGAGRVGVAPRPGRAEDEALGPGQGAEVGRRRRHPQLRRAARLRLAGGSVGLGR